ncbi:MAG TPA: type II toxin-antitoxin system HicA family toxin [Pseudobdellovibrionaceae bacterium]|nr:type II toxin-antitoxin system HicA family toxin [Pseudobdellovibrionaceae bacterium]
MKKRDLESELKKLGWWLVPGGGKHDKWTNGVFSLAVPRHKEINEFTARGILKEAKRLKGAK